MIKKFITIKNVGKFRNCYAAGDIEFRKLSLVYGENGRGKSTLSSILRSLQCGDPLCISERRTLDGTESPLVEVLTDSGKLCFKGTAWTSSYPDLVVFDSTYITENVYSGDFIEHDQKKRLYQHTIGKAGVDLAKKVVDLDAKSRELAGKIKEKREALSKKVPQGMEFEHFIALERDEGIEEKIEAKKKELQALVDSESIKSKAGFVRLTMPSLPEGLLDLLAKTVEEVSRDAEIKVQQQIEKHHMPNDGQVWLSRGLNFVREDSCPFCSQNVKENPLLEAYRSFFSVGYREFKEKVKILEVAFANAFSERKIAAIKTTLVQNQANQQFWAKYASVPLPEVHFEDEVSPIMQRITDTITPLIQQKSATPLEALQVSPETQSCIAALDALKTPIEAYNQCVDDGNGVVNAVKRSIEAGNSAIVRNELKQLELRKLRHSSEVDGLCLEFQKLEEEKTAIEKEKGTCKKQLDEHTEKVLGRYEEGINKLLERFCAGFRLAGVKHQYLGGSPSSTFKLSINGVPVDVGDSGTPRGTPCFRTTMGSGDRNTLALAFFLVQLQQRTDIGNLTVVFDDPFTSLDRFRQQYTRDQIRSVERVAKQVIVFSHEPAFLQLVADDFDSSKLRLLCVARDGVSDSVIKPWDMHTEMAAGFHQDIVTLLAFYHGEGKELRSVIRCLRPVLEAFLRMSYTGQFPDNEWLGSMIARIRECLAGSPLDGARMLMPDLESLNDYTKRYHHDDNSEKTGSGPIQDAELQQFCKLTLGLIGRL